MNIKGVEGRAKADDAFRTVLGLALEHRDWRAVRSAFEAYGTYLQLLDAADRAPLFYGRQ